MIFSEVVDLEELKPRLDTIETILDALSPEEIIDIEDELLGDANKTARQVFGSYLYGIEASQVVGFSAKRELVGIAELGDTVFAGSFEKVSIIVDPLTMVFDQIKARPALEFTPAMPNELPLKRIDEFSSYLGLYSHVAITTDTTRVISRVYR